METLEIIGIILIFIGVIYIFLQGLGKLSDQGGEIETKILSLKGGAGLILVALGIVLLTLGGGLLADLSEKLPLPSEVKEILGNTAQAKTSEPSMPTLPPLSNSVSSTPTPVTPLSKTVVLTEIEKESGCVGSGGKDEYWNSCSTNTVGYGLNNHGATEQSFLSFNMAGVPVNATITKATLDFSTYDRTGDPFSYYGCLGAYVQDYGAPDSNDFFIGTPTGAIAKWCSDGELSSPSPSNDLMSALQPKLGKSRFQIRVQFDKVIIGMGNNYIYLRAPQLIVTYIA
jgi:hypothetical protein